MVACDFAGNDLQFMLHGDLAEKVARDHVTPNLASPEGEGFPPSPMGTLTIGNGASPGSDGNHQPLRWKMTRRPSNANYHQTVKDRPTGGRLRGHKEVPSQVPDDSGRIVASLDRKRLGADCWGGEGCRTEAFSIRRLGGSRWRLRRTRCAMGFGRQRGSERGLGRAATRGGNAARIVGMVLKTSQSVCGEWPERRWRGGGHTSAPACGSTSLGRQW